MLCMCVCCVCCVCCVRCCVVVCAVCVVVLLCVRVVVCALLCVVVWVWESVCGVCGYMYVCGGWIATRYTQCSGEPHHYTE